MIKVAASLLHMLVDPSLSFMIPAGQADKPCSQACSAQSHNCSVSDEMHHMAELVKVPLIEVLQSSKQSASTVCKRKGPLHAAFVSQDPLCVLLEIMSHVMTHTQ